MQSYEDYVAERNKKAEEKIAHLKPRVFEALANNPFIATVTVEFEGSGDSGGIEEVTARTSAGSEIGLSADLKDDIETLSYTIIEQHWSGYENNEGGYGEVVFGVARRSIAATINERYVSYDTTTMEI